MSENASPVDLIHSATPLEMHFDGVHPRVYATAEHLTHVREAIGRNARYQRVLAKIRANADAWLHREPEISGDARGVGEAMANLAMAWQLESREADRDAALSLLRAALECEDWGEDLTFGHWANGAACVVDWLWDHIEPVERAEIVRKLAGHGERVYQSWVRYANAGSTGYAWNHMTVVLGGLTALGCALWGETEGGVSRWLRLALEKTENCMRAVGDDGYSPEGFAYGNYWLDYVLKAAVLCRDLLGVDLVADNPHVRQYPDVALYGLLPGTSWPDRKAFVQLADSSGHHWYGPCPYLRLAAALHGDQTAQWLADYLDRGEADCPASAYLELLWMDVAVPASPPVDHPGLLHCADKGVVYLRDGWGDDCEVAAFQCGPNAGHAAVSRYRHDVSGGHMHPGAGHLVIHAAGDWLLMDAGYTWKWTRHKNTLLVNGQGQLGEGHAWFEDLPFRQGRPEGRILAVEHSDRFDRITANFASTYAPALGVTRCLRHVLYFRPGCWLVIDEVQAREPVTWQWLWHSHWAFESISAEQAAAVASGTDRFPSVRHVATGPRGRLTVDAWLCADQPLRADAGAAVLQGVNNSSHADQEVQRLMLAPTDAVQSAVLITLLRASKADAPPVPAAAARLPERDSLLLRLPAGAGAVPADLLLAPWQLDPSDRPFLWR